VPHHATLTGLAALACLGIGCGSDGGASGSVVDGGAEASAPPDGGAAIADPPGDGGASTPPGSRCRVTSLSVRCDHHVTPLTAGPATRDVYWQTPATTAPPQGYPIVVLFQGSFGGPAITFAELTPDAPFGGFHQGRLQAMLLDRGFTIVAPEAAAGIAWQTNSGLPYETTTDRAVIDALLAALRAGAYGPADPTRLYATGISSGGYMTSRMAVSHGGVFRALAVQSASYATCAGAVCLVPSALPIDHPPTLLLHGGADLTVPAETGERYHAALVASGVTARWVLDPPVGHAWLASSPAEITAWFEAH